MPGEKEKLPDSSDCCYRYLKTNQSPDLMEFHFTLSPPVITAIYSPSASVFANNLNGIDGKDGREEKEERRRRG
jgi:hypothetical protein